MDLPKYPRIITIKDQKLVKLERDKGTIIEEGRAISQKIADVELEMGKIDVRLQTAEAAVDVNDLKARGEELLKEMEAMGKKYMEQIKEVEQQIFDKMSANTDPTLRTEYAKLDKQKADLENERNKKALKAQKLKDRIIPMARRLMKPYLENKYEDFHDIRLEGDVMIGTIFSHLDEWNKRFEAKLEKEAEQYK